MRREHTNISSLTPLQYIESTGTQYIDTGFKLNHNSRVVIQCMITKLMSDSTLEIDAFGCQQFGWENNCYKFALAVQTNKIAGCYGNRGWVGNTYSLVNKLVVADLNRNYITVNVQGYSTYYRTLTSNTFQNLDNSLLFKCYYPTDFPATDGIMTEDGHLRIYLCDIYDNGVQVRKFRPYLNAGEGGLLDELNNVWYGNNGTGEFLYN